MAEGQEIELKFEIDPAVAGRLEQKLVLRARAKTPAAQQTLVSTYYDTRDRDLRNAGFTLRVRHDGARWVQTVKTDAVGVSHRGEWEVELGGADMSLAAAAHTPLGPLLKGLASRPDAIFTTRVKRTTHQIRVGKARVEAALDHGLVEGGSRSETFCELELELKAGDAAALHDLAHRLGGASPLRLGFETKAARGYRLSGDKAVAEAIKGDFARLRPDMSCHQAFQTIAAAALRQWIGNAAVLRAARRPEALHQMRVGLRRLRTALKLFERVVGDDVHLRLVGELKWLASELDHGRDIDVLIEETFRPAARRFHSQSGMAALGERLLKARTRAYDRILAILDGPRHLGLALDMAAWIDCGPWSQRTGDPSPSPADAPVADLARQALNRLRRQIKTRGRKLTRLDAASRHSLRIRTKRMRYAVEFFGGLYMRRKDQRDAFHATLRTLQERLGILNDLNVARDRGLALAEGGGRAAGESETEGAQQAFAAGLMIGVRAVDEEALLKQASDSYGALMDARPFWK
jgi:triphosphatase